MDSLPDETCTCSFKAQILHCFSFLVPLGILRLRILRLWIFDKQLHFDWISFKATDSL